MVTIAFAQQMQHAWLTHVTTVSECYPQQFWRFFGAVYEETVTTQDKVFKALKDVVPVGERKWPTSVRQLRSVTRKNAGDFWDNVLHTVRIDLSSYQIRCKYVEFTFVDPCYAWMRQCAALQAAQVPTCRTFGTRLG